MKKGLSIIINIILFAIIVLLAWQVVKSIQAPIKFSNEQKTREAKVIERLLDIRNAEVLYKNANNKYTNNFDTLIQFCQTAEIPLVKMVSKQNMEDSTYFTVYDTIGYVKVMDSLRAGRDNFNINEIKWVPFSEPQQQFELEAGAKTNNLIEIPVFEARTPYDVYLAVPGGGINEKEWKQRVDNAKAEKEGGYDKDDPFYRYPGLKVGSMKEASTEGNWDKL
jgi:hypothetical protein